MEWFSYVTGILSLLGVPTLIVWLWMYIRDKRKEKSDAVQELKKQQNKTLIGEVLDERLNPINSGVASIGNKLDKVEAGTLSTLRNDILTCYYRCREKGYRNDYDYTNVHDLYDAYKNLGGNSFIEDVMERFDHLPTKEAYNDMHKEEGIKVNE